MNYVKYLVEDFVLDQSFKDWVLHNQNAQNAFWELWIKHHPEKYEEIKEARKIIMILHNRFSPKVKEDIESRRQEVCN